MDQAFIEEQIARYKTLITAYSDAILAITVEGIQSYTLDTGQSRQTVTRIDLDRLQRTLDSLFSQLEVWQTRLDGGGVSSIRPGF